MKKTVFYLQFISLSFAIQGQNTPIYNWQEHLSYGNAKHILEVENHIYCATENGLFYYNKEDYTINRLNKITGLSDVGVSAMNYDSENNIIIITYYNTNVDLIKGDDIINITDIKDKFITGEKEIHNVDIEEGVAYFSTSFGLLLMDLKKEEIIDTYKIGENGNFVGINDCYIDDTCIFVGTTDGVYFADKNSNTLFDFNSWTKHPSHPSEVSEIIVNSSGILFNSQYPSLKVRNCNGYYLEIGSIISVYQNNNLISEVSADSNFSNIQDAWMDKDNILWIADSSNSLLKYENFEFSEVIKPNGPSSNTIENIKLQDNFLFLLHNNSKNSVSRTGDIIDWLHWDYFSEVVCSEKIGSITYVGSSTSGLAKKDGQQIIRYTPGNTQNILDTNYYISNLTSDREGNLWGTVSNSGKTLFVRSSDNYWTYFFMPQLPNDRDIRNLIIDDYGQKWGSVRAKGLFVYNDNGTIEDKSDDQYKVITTSVGNGNLPNQEVYALVSDLDGNVWAGTKEGVCVFYSPSSVFSGYNFDAQQIIVEENGFGQYLLESEIVYSIAVDGGNRKWIGTLESGLYLLSEDGTEEIEHFTKENSPLLSNTILDIELNHKTAEIFISTDKGLMSFRNDATKGKTNINSVDIFPNPVREDYYGNISINGIAYESNVKITDVSGNLVFETTSNGGMAIWDGTDSNNNRVGTGVYLVFCSDKDGGEKAVGKILFIH
ncbi:MAG: hypothetical protein CMD22_04965 [Flavobacteriales bacterium]|nr:hypothetical protein [Flavobacteriales bacterium]|tara:strand:+ start:24149 stop:26296 length:2148 start_codon:yes stop_codon:yes gene_type:complete